MTQRALLRAQEPLRIVGRELLRLVVRMLGTVAAASFFVFVLLEVSISGGYRSVVLGPGAASTRRGLDVVETYHLDENVVVRYAHWVSDAVRGDFGRSAASGDSITDIIVHRLPISIELMAVATVITLLVGIPLGLLAAAWNDRRLGGWLNMVFGLSQSIPVFVTPLFLITFFAVSNQWLPAAGWTRLSVSVTGNVRGLVLPVTALVLAEFGIVARIVRADVLRVLNSEFIAAARGKGLSERYVLFRHALRPASLGLINVIGLNIGSLLTGALVVEVIFGIGGLGQVLLEATLGRDLYVLLGVTSYVVVVYVLLNTMVDGLLRWLDPRISR